MLPKSTGNSRLVPLRVFASPFGILALGVVLNFAALSQIAIASTRLVMVTSDHCPFCQAWERDIGVLYEKSIAMHGRLILRFSLLQVKRKKK